jgi:hypothetical protein
MSLKNMFNIGKNRFVPETLPKKIGVKKLRQKSAVISTTKSLIKIQKKTSNKFYKKYQLLYDW